MLTKSAPTASPIATTLQGINGRIRRGPDLLERASA